MRKERKKSYVMLVIIPIILLSVIAYMCINYYEKEKKAKEYQTKINEIKEKFNDNVLTRIKTVLYTKNDNIYVESGKVNENIYLILNKEKSDYNNGYFMIENLSNELEKSYFIYYKDIEKIENELEYSQRYKNYVPYNKTIVTNDIFSLYDEDDKFIYELNSKKELPVIVNNDNFYGVEFNNQLLYIKNKDIKEIKNQVNTEGKNTTGIAVLNYHFVYNENVDLCNQIICHTEAQFSSHLEYIKNNNIFTPTLKELEMYIDGKIQLNKSVVITIDDGWHSLEAATLLNKYKLNGTVFLITSGYDKNSIESEFVEVHSHTHNMHNAGDCPSGQGGGIQCLSEEFIQEDLKKSREKLNNTTYFCYPFYEYNDYSISQLKKAGFTMAFAGYYANGKLKASPGIDKFQIPRYIIYNTTTVEKLKNMIGW